MNYNNNGVNEHTINYSEYLTRLIVKV